MSQDFVDSTDFLPTFAEIAGAKLPAKIIDGHSIAPQIQGKNGQPREWIFIQLANQFYVRAEGWKLNQAGELFDMSKAPFEEPLVAADSKNPAAIAARLDVHGHRGLGCRGLPHPRSHGYLGIHWPRGAQEEE